MGDCLNNVEGLTKQKGLGVQGRRRYIQLFLLPAGRKAKARIVREILPQKPKMQAKYAVPGIEDVLAGRTQVCLGVYSSRLRPQIKPCSEWV